MQTDEARRAELAQFLLSRRNRLRPEDFGIRTGRHRRAEGLRREEVAYEAGISTTWYVRLEQGRDVRASAHALKLLGRALRLSRPEQNYLFQLARPDLDWKGRTAEQERPSDNLISLLDGLAPHPAYVLNRYWEMVAINRPAVALLGAFDASEEWSTNLIARLFLDSHWRRLFRDWEDVARSAVAQFRLTTAAAPDDPVLERFIAAMEDMSPEFSSLWHSHEIAEPPIWRKTIAHAVAGEMTFEFATLRPGGRDSEYFVSIYTPAGDEDRRRMQALSDA